MYNHWGCIQATLQAHPNNHNTHDKQTNVYAHETLIGQGNVVTFQSGPLESSGCMCEGASVIKLFQKNINFLCDAIGNPRGPRRQKWKLTGITI